MKPFFGLVTVTPDELRKRGKMIKHLYFGSVLQCQEQIYHFQSCVCVVMLGCVDAGLLAGPSYSPSATLAAAKGTD